MSAEGESDAEGAPRRPPPADEWQPEPPADIGDYDFVEVKEGRPPGEWPPVHERR